MNNHPENSLHCEQLESFCLIVNKGKVDGNVAGGTFEMAGFVPKDFLAWSDTKKFKP